MVRHSYPVHLSFLKCFTTWHTYTMCRVVVVGSSHKSRFEHCTVVLLLLLLLLLLVGGEERGKNSLAQPTMICGIWGGKKSDIKSITKIIFSITTSLSGTLMLAIAFQRPASTRAHRKLDLFTKSFEKCFYKINVRFLFSFVYIFHSQLMF